MNDNLEMRSLKKRLAMHDNVDDALSVILPRLMGAIRHAKVPNFLRPNELQTAAGGYEVRLNVNKQCVILYLVDAELNDLFACGIYSGMVGEHYNGLIDIFNWERGCWQTEIFDLFDKDSYWLLDLPRVEDTPLIVKVARAEITRLWAAKIAQFPNDPSSFDDVG
ncbi:hypothetical protein NKI32_03800 [Mesorhizobium sp. M0761]|uniref:hypothetical protein n=1 Tax=Mesorhizobium sp. M0761 TaxID=2956994 RepID=UPI00333D8E50